MSSPISGAHHFECKEEGREFKWISTRDNSINLLDKIDLELSSLL
jgi:frataxin-like iron-binding protein CyaY